MTAPRAADNLSLPKNKVPSKGPRKNSFADRGVINPYRLSVGVLVPQGVLEDTKLSPGAKLCYGLLARHAGKDGKCYPKEPTLALEMSVSEDTVGRYIKQLSTQGYVYVQRRGRGWSNRYYFLEHPNLLDCRRKLVGDPAKVPDQEPAKMPGLDPSRMQAQKENPHHQNPLEKIHSPVNVKLAVDSQLQEEEQNENSNSMNPDDCDGNPSPEAASKVPRQAGNSPEEEFRMRLHARHGTTLNADEVLTAVKQGLEKANIPIEEFLQTDEERTTNPAGLKNAPGYYRAIAREVVRKYRLKVAEQSVKLSLAMRGVELAPGSKCKYPGCGAIDGRGMILVDGRLDACPNCLEKATPETIAWWTSKGIALSAQRSARSGAIENSKCKS